MAFKELYEKVKQYNPHSEEERLKNAYEFAKKCHEGQFRNSGEPYFIHPVAVAMILTDIHMDDDTIIGGLLHDVLEDTEVIFDDIAMLFGEDVAQLVEGVTKLKKIKYKTKQESQSENLRKMVLAMSQDIRVVIIKLADRLHNMRTLEYMTRTKQIEKAQETIQIYAPLAHRLGISTIKWELEDLSLRYLEPQEYYDIVNKIKDTRTQREDFIQRIIRVLRKELDKMHIPADIVGRPKSICSIYKKMKKQNKSFEEIYDLSAMRIIVNTTADCYAALGAVHALWKPIPGRVKDYIAMPKPNLYQSLHTTVIDRRGEVFEVQIRTHEMHKTAEYGIAAHWKYKEGDSKMSNFDEKLTWLRQLMDWQQELSDPREFIETVKEEFTTDEVFVFSPKGDVIDLPEGSTPIDFAYRVHSAVGNHCVGAKVDGRIVPLTHKLHTGNIVEILTSSNSTGPSKDWLNIVKSSSAKTKIRQFFKKERKSQNIVLGKDMLEKAVAKEGYGFNEMLKEDWLDEVAEKMSFNSVEDLYAAIGYGSTKVTQVIPKLRELHDDYYKTDKAVEKTAPRQQELRRTSENGILIKGVDNIQIKIANCCNPVPGDDIIGYITRGRGITVHRHDCSNVRNVGEERLIPVYWDDDGKTTYNVRLRIVAFDRVGYLANVTEVVQEEELNLISVNAKREKDKSFVVILTVEITNTEQIRSLMEELKNIKGTLDVYRVKA
ncbi:MAG: bifunctional (p)ppGpp synthetase/guanosine-3',5'-bis(diphosphate) 3'-pyrophosphohydrolase [Tissierellia bacterium]|nr:bifunctional (p)ppGpp synthetase/guanosine-3',5'-bis(diphosphate) 3'-pyrophosphohydrolase [Tissierellia bacterium]